QTCDQAAFQRVRRRSHDDRDALRCALRGADCSGAADYDDIDLRPQQIADQRGYGFDIVAIMAKLIGDVAPFDITEVAHPAHEFLAKWIVPRGSRPDVPDTRRLARLLRTRCERPGRRRAAEQPDERAPIHSIISSLLIVWSSWPGDAKHRQRGGLRKMPPARGLPWSRPFAGHRSDPRFPMLSSPPPTRARDWARSPPPCARRCLTVSPQTS